VKHLIKTLTFLYVLIIPVNLLFAQKDKTMNLVLGTFYEDGLQVYEFNTETGDVQLRNKLKTPGAVFATTSKDNKRVYTVSQENGEAFVNSYEFDPKTGELKFLNKVSGKGSNPSYITLDEKGNYLFVPHFDTGNTSVLSVLNDGTVGEVIQVVQHTGKGPHATRQDRPRAHATVFTPDHKYMMVADLGIDKIMMYKFDPSNAKEPLTPAPVPFVNGKSGGGTRVMVVHPNRKFVYSIEEITADVAVYAYKDGVLTPVQTITMINPETGTVGSAADIQVSPDGKFLYASNRGEVNELVVYAIDAKTGMLEYKSRQSTKGRTPRYIAIDPSGNYVLASNMGQGNGGRRGAPNPTPPATPPLSSVVIFKRDKATGQLTDTGKKIDVIQPGFIMFVPK
jgi:6-phosphogluconolactonase